MAELTESDFLAILQTIEDHAAASGWFDRVNRHEPKNAPGYGLTAAIWVDRIEPVPARSGLAATSGRLVVNVRIYSSMLAEPQDAIDPHVTAAVNVLMVAYSGDFTLGGLVEKVDLLGAHGVPLSAQAGYLNQDNKVYRVMTITVPLALNDLWSQQP